MNIDVLDLRKNKSGIDYKDGYRVVYFYENEYEVGEYSKSIEGFMMGFADSYPIMSEKDIPEFVSNEDLLDRYLEEISDVNAVAIYDINGKCICKKERDLKKA